jgi:hypothetical protein
MITAFWLVVGGYWSYSRHTTEYDEYKSNVEYICSSLSENSTQSSDCINKKLDTFNAKLSEVGYWQDVYQKFAFDLFVGLALIWGIALGARWAMKGS